MRKLEDLLEDHRGQRHSGDRLDIILCAVVIALHYAGIKVEKLSIGGAELIFKETYVLNACIGLVIYFLLLSSLRSHLAVGWALSVLAPRYEEEAKSTTERILLSVSRAPDFGCLR